MSDNPTQKPTKRLIKEAIRDLLKGQTEARDRVMISQSVPNQKDALPRILIYTTNEDSTRHDESPKDYRRVLKLVVECIDQGDSDDGLDEQLEVIGDIVERKLELDETLGGLLDRLEYTGATYAYSDDGSVPTGSIALTFDLVFYEYAIRKNSVCYPAFKEAGVEWETAPNAEITATDLYNLEQGETP